MGWEEIDNLRGNNSEWSQPGRKPHNKCHPVVWNHIFLETVDILRFSGPPWFLTFSIFLRLNMTDVLLRSYLAGSRTEVEKKTKANESWALSWRTSCRSLTRQEANAWPRPSFYVSSDPRLTILRVSGDTLMLILFTLHLSKHLLRPLIHLAGESMNVQL